MKKEHAMKWVEALRSGKYEQGEGFLCKDGKYCCLGVLCEIFPELDLAGGGKQALNNFDRIGLKSSLGRLPTSGAAIVVVPATLSSLNDGEYRLEGIYSPTKLKLNFDEIADIIQIEYVEGL